MNRTDALEAACVMSRLYAEINPDLSPAMQTEVMYWLNKSILGEAHGLWEGYAAEMIRWLEHNIEPGQYVQFKAAQNTLVKFGVIPGPNAEGKE